MDSILTSVKKLLGIDESYEHFDSDIIMHINSVLMGLYQIGAGKEGFTITSKNETWADLMGDKSCEAVKSYVALKVRMMFDPPASSITAEAINKNISELEWRICSEAERITSSREG